MDVGCDASAPSAVRRSITALSVLGRVLGDALVLASELVTHAVEHSGRECEDDRLEVVVSRGADAVVISVLDRAFSGQESTVRAAPDPHYDGLGMVIVDRLARRWGIEHDGGYRVWAELGLPRTPLLSRTPC